jgi:hypothetical protein
MNKKLKKQSEQPGTEPKVYGDPVYSAKDDIYAREEKREYTDTEEEAPSAPSPDETIRKSRDLDVPGSELDDADEQVGEEDEENNYYSLGGDNHDDLEEDNGD